MVIVSSNEKITIVFRLQNPVSAETEKTLNDLARVLGMQLGISLKEDPKKADQLIKIMLQKLASVSEEMKKIIETPLFPSFF